MAATAPSMALDARAKVNLYLHVTGRRADGYHELDSLIVFAGVADRLSFAPAPDFVLSLTGRFAGAVPRGRENLVERAAHALANRFQSSAGARLVLEKNLPVAAGLGGGSADAAATLRGLAALWNLRATKDDLREIAAELGADVPVCLDGRPSFIGGIGEQVMAVGGLPHAWLVLVNPNLPLSTPTVFAHREGVFSREERWHSPVQDAAALARLLVERRNDLEPPARALMPEVAEVLARILETPGCLLSRMSGSGATCFGLFASRREAEAAAAMMTRLHPAWWVRSAPILR